MTLEKLTVDKWVEVINFLNFKKQSSYQDISYGLRINSNHINDIVRLLEEKKFVKKYKLGRTVQVSLTKRGQELAHDCTGIITKMGVDK